MFTKKITSKHSIGIVDGARRHGRIDIGSAGVDQISPSFVKPFYDVWSETVNTANKMESHAEPGRIQVSGPAREQLVGDYSFEQRGTVEVKGMG